MIKTARVSILEQLTTDIVKLKSANGYELNALEFIKGFNPNASNNFPYVVYEMGQSQYTPVGDSMRDMYKGTLLLALHYFVSADTKQGDLVTVGELALNDFRKFVHSANDVNIDKVLNLNKCDNGKTINILNWHITSELPVADNTQTNAIATTIIQVNFIETMDKNLVENLQSR